MNDNNANCVGASLVARQQDVYNVGDVVKVINYGYSLGKYNEGQVVSHGQQVIEVEIKSVKTAKTVLE